MDIIGVNRTKVGIGYRGKWEFLTLTSGVLSLSTQTEFALNSILLRWNNYAKPEGPVNIFIGKAGTTLFVRFIVSLYSLV